MRALIAAALLVTTAPAIAQSAPQASAPAAAISPYRAQAVRQTITLPAFRFHDGRSRDVRMSALTLGTPRRDARGRIVNAVVLLHGTGGSAGQFLVPQFADQLFGAGQPLDTSRYHIVMVDNLGHGESSRPSADADFPSYTYADMTLAQARLLSAMGVERARLFLGTSMGCMHIFVWANRWPDRMQAAMPMACIPAPIVGHNRAWRTALVETIKADPGWSSGNAPIGMRGANAILMTMGAAPATWARLYPTGDSAAAMARARVAAPGLDPRDLIAATEASRDYAPDPARMPVAMTWINSADDVINPPGYYDPPALAARMADVRYRLIPVSDQTRGHGTHTWAQFWKDDLVALLARTEAR